MRAYFGMRKISLGAVGNETNLRPLLNNKFVFHMGMLDQVNCPLTACAEACVPKPLPARAAQCLSWAGLEAYANMQASAVKLYSKCACWTRDLLPEGLGALSAVQACIPQLHVKVKCSACWTR